MEEAFTGEFENTFAESYMRNHKAVTVKNLRCFPRCSDNEHKDNGFCGNLVIIRWNAPTKTESLEAFSEFQEASLPARFELNSIVSDEDIHSIQTLMRGEVIRNDSLSGKITFSRESKGWHYGWMAGRGNGSQAFHEMRIYLFEKRADGTYICKLYLQSPQFQVTSRKRVRQKKTADPDQLSTEKPNRKRKADDESPLFGEKLTKPKLSSSPSKTKLNELPKDHPLTNMQEPPFTNHLQSAVSGTSTLPSTAQQRSANFFQNIFQNGYPISSTPPTYQHISSTPPTYNFPFLFSNNSQHSILSAPAPAPSDYEVLDVLWQPTPPNSFAQILFQRQQLIKQMEDEKEKQQQQQQQPARPVL